MRQKQYVLMFGHYNGHLHVSYEDDPAIAMLVLNEMKLIVRNTQLMGKVFVRPEIHIKRSRSSAG